MTNLSNWCLNYNTLSMIHVLLLFHIFILYLRTTTFTHLFWTDFSATPFSDVTCCQKKKTKLTTSSRKSRTSGTGNRFRIVQGVPEGSPVILQKVYSSIRVIMFHECRTESINAKRFPMHQFGFKNKVLQRSCLKSKFHTNTFFWCF